MRYSVLIIACLLLIAPSQAEAENVNQADDVQQQLKVQEKRLNHIEEQAATERQQIEIWYEGCLMELRQLAERKAKQLKPDTMALWTEFIKMNEKTSPFDTYFKMNDRIPNAYGYFMNNTLIFLRDVETFKLRAALMDGFFLSAAADLLMDNNFRKRLVDLADGSAYNPQNLLIRDQARKLLYFANEFQLKLSALQDRKAVKLAAVAQWERDRKEDVLRVMREIKDAPERGNEGVVSAIICSQKAALCMIDGFDEVLKEGDSAGNILIVKINPDHVEFSKGSEKWTQMVGKPAGDAWK